MSFTSGMANTFCLPQTNTIGRPKPPNWTTITMPLDDYNPNSIKLLLRKVQEQFGWHGQNWYFNSNFSNLPNLNYQITFAFKNPHDATIFALKFLERRD